MSNDLNQCQFIGRLGAEPETRFTQSGEAVCNFRLAVGWKTSDKEGAEWVPVVAFGKKAELCGEHLHKGSRVFVQGKFKTRKWQDKDGKDRYTTEINLDQLQFLDSRAAGGHDNLPPEARTPPRQAGAAAPAPAQGFDQFDDDIPF
jgi:single-strand DNA-binding protein